ncbi:uncharacterized protein LOC133319768 [Danaus plexippus]|uniref:uncharacterized protein LOC133319768 n=1 Tax=Danaus plexippus TaxID=13037 RepID=UPI002AAF9852|nr:uncharacterized protein LOC133319768 [Danaus plexippus]
MILLLCFVATIIIPASMQSTFSNELCQYPKDPACRNRQALYLRVLDDSYKDDMEYIQALRSWRSRHRRHKKLSSNDVNDLDEKRRNKRKRLYGPVMIFQAVTSALELVHSVVQKIG